MSGNTETTSRMPRPIALYAPSGMMLDATDLSILRLLQTDARMTVQAIADHTGLSHSGALHRMNRLDQSGAVVCHVAQIDETVFDAWPLLFVEIILTRSGRLAREDLDAAIRDTPEIIEAIEIVGECDVLLKVALPSPAHWAALQRQLDPTADLIETSRPHVIGRTIKRKAPHPLLNEA